MRLPALAVVAAVIGTVVIAVGHDDDGPAARTVPSLDETNLGCVARFEPALTGKPPATRSSLIRRLLTPKVQRLLVSSPERRVVSGISGLPVNLPPSGRGPYVALETQPRATVVVATHGFTRQYVADVLTSCGDFEPDGQAPESAVFRGSARSDGFVINYDGMLVFGRRLAAIRAVAQALRTPRTAQQSPFAERVGRSGAPRVGYVGRGIICDDPVVLEEEGRENLLISTGPRPIRRQRLRVRDAAEAIHDLVGIQRGTVSEPRVRCAA